MGQILVRNLDDAVIAALKQRASQQKTSVEQTAREILATAARLSKEETWAKLDRIRAIGQAVNT